MSARRYKSFSEFYPYYLSEHQDPRCRALHYIGSCLVIVCLAWVIVTASWLWLLVLPLIGYGFAWIGHLGFEKNRPATFQYPLYSFLGDWRMLFDFLTGRLNKHMKGISSR
ncbi:DUF962 domain-containing protein [Corallincola platygyrae]|uniref:DUF962 domain-containing protein n=1 Tax=Corallincola platygyrae TaxID=1193278 RepID=A0ABW4XTL8_9GAMM